MNILITRPSPYGIYLANTLNQIGKKAWHFPLITFMPGNDLPLLEQRLKKLTHQDLLFIMSQTAIKYAHTWLIKSNISWPQKVHYYAIGHTTALQAHEFTKTTSIIYPKTQETSEALLRLPELNTQKLKGKQALIICGHGGRKILKKELKQRGVHVITCKSYSRIPILYNGQEKIEYMITIGINTIVITSQEILQHLYNLTPNQYKNNWLTKCKLIVVSKRIAKYAKQLGWDNIIVTHTANNNNLINTLLNL